MLWYSPIRIVQLGSGPPPNPDPFQCEGLSSAHDKVMNLFALTYLIEKLQYYRVGLVDFLGVAHVPEDRIKSN
jgi:hypothetical protein